MMALRIFSKQNLAQPLPQAILRMVEEAKLGPKARLPTEREFCQRLGVTRHAVRKALEGKRGRGRVTLVVPMTDESEAEVTLPGTYSIAGGLRDTIGSLPGVAQVEEI